MSGATSKGVDELIARLRDDGVSAGRAEAERLVQEAEAQAAKIVAGARAEAEALRAEARREADTYRAAGEQALETAMRDGILRMKAGMEGQLREQMQRLVGAHVADADLLKRMILEVAGRMRDAAQQGDAAELILPPAVLGPDEIREQAGDIRSGELTQYVLGLTGEMLRDGLTLHAGGEGQQGIRVRVQEGEVEIDLTAQAIAALLLEHMQPRFRAVLEGVIRS